MRYLNPSRFASRVERMDDTQFVNYLEACRRSPLLTDAQKAEWFKLALKVEAKRDEPRKPRVAKLNQKRKQVG